MHSNIFYRAADKCIESIGPAGRMHQYSHLIEDVQPAIERLRESGHHQLLIIVPLPDLRPDHLKDVGEIDREMDQLIGEHLSMEMYASETSLLSVRWK